MMFDKRKKLNKFFIKYHIISYGRIETFIIIGRVIVFKCFSRDYFMLIRKTILSFDPHWKLSEIWPEMCKDIEFNSNLTY